MSKISCEYAQALYMLAEENAMEESYGKELDMVDELFVKNPDYLKFLGSYAVSKEEKLSALDEAFSNVLQKEVLSFLKLLCERKHIGEFSHCVAEYRAMLNEKNRITEAKVTSAVELSEEEKTALINKLEKLCGNKVEAEFAQDPAILGGLIVEMEGEVMDSSLRKHLKDVKDVINR